MKTNYFASNIRFLRKLNNMTQLDLGNALKISRATISAWEKETRKPIFADVATVCDFFRVPIGDMLGKDISLDYDKNLALDNQRELITLFNQLTSEQQTEVLEIIRGLTM